jgi:hypothetical protein
MKRCSTVPHTRAREHLALASCNHAPAPAALPGFFFSGDSVRACQMLNWAPSSTSSSFFSVFFTQEKTFFVLHERRASGGHDAIMARGHSGSIYDCGSRCVPALYHPAAHSVPLHADTALTGSARAVARFRPLLCGPVRQSSCCFLAHV